MNFESYIKRNVQTVEYNVWLTGKASASGETPLFVLDENNYPIGTLNIFGGIDPIGKTTLLSLRSISVDLSSYEIWAVFSDTGNLIGWFKKSELYEEYYSAAFEKLDLLRRMFKSLPCKLVAVDEAGVVQYANDDFMEDYDFSASAALGRPLCDIAPEHPLLYIVKNARTAQLIYSENGFLHIQCSLEKNGEFIGAMQISFLCDSVMQPAVFESASSDGFITDIRAYYDSNWDVVYASDKKYASQTILGRPAAGFEVYTDPNDFSSVREELEKQEFAFVSAEVSNIPQNYVEVTDEEVLVKIKKMLAMLEDLDDVQEVYHNADIDEEE